MHIAELMNERPTIVARNLIAYSAAKMLTGALLGQIAPSRSLRMTLRSYGSYFFERGTQHVACSSTRGIDFVFDADAPASFVFNKLFRLGTTPVKNKA